MWLINTTSLQLEQVLEPRNEGYAILSHTWGDEEVSFQEFTSSDVAKKRAEFDKIERLCKMAVSRGLKYAWIDTCCIDKTSSAELSEAINSMFEWYKQSQVCFAFIADLPPVARGDPLLDWLEQGQYRWFTRGWTLQELIAPRKLEFFDSTWKFRGEKSTLHHGISLKTGIDMSVLKDSAYLSGVPVGQKMSWASARKTTRVEDIAYCLLGIFGINMPLIYGEGDKAFIRLQEEIAKDHNDLSLFSWVAESERETESQPFRGILAKSPSEFAHCSGVMAFNDYLGPNPEFSLTNNGLRMEAKLGLSTNMGYVLALDCVTVPAEPPSFSYNYLGIYLRKTGSGYVRQHPHKLFSTTDSSIWSVGRTTVYIRKSLGTKDNHQIRTEIASRIYIRYLPAKPHYSVEDMIWSPDALWNPDGDYFLTMESALPSSRGFRPLFTGFKGFNINYQGVHVCSCLLICGIFLNAQGDLRPLAVLYTDKDPSTKDVFEVVKRRRHEQGSTLLAEVRAFVLSKHAPTHGDRVLTWRHLCDRVTEVIMGNHCTIITLSINLVASKKGEVSGEGETHAGTLTLGPDIRDLPDEPSGLFTSARSGLVAFSEPDCRRYVVSVRVEDGNGNLKL
ncbi:heterokaryon incompatibility protein-domain-containing protein [Nemania abortiva]|nr:heterokaryon incompatibility protein-domain-containing protein [Nemania abortiva]